MVPLWLIETIKIPVLSIMIGKFQLQESNPAIVYLNRYVPLSYYSIGSHFF